jgi:hypothetical protein
MPPRHAAAPAEPSPLTALSEEVSGKTVKVFYGAAEGASPGSEWFRVVTGEFSTSWYLDDKLHRVDGPAVEWADGYKSWYLNGIQVTEAEHAARTVVIPRRTSRSPE